LAATEYYYRRLIKRHGKSNTALDLTIVHADLRELARNLADRKAQRQVEAFLPLVQRLAAAGAELAAITSMGGHFCVEELKKISPLQFSTESLKSTR
jgi:aspartate racemase